MTISLEFRERLTMPIIIELDGGHREGLKAVMLDLTRTQSQLKEIEGRLHDVLKAILKKYVEDGCELQQKGVHIIDINRGLVQITDKPLSFNIDPNNRRGFGFEESNN